MDIKKIGIVGAGAMGSGIAQVLATAAIEVVLSDIAEAQLQRGLATISSSLDRLIKKEKLTLDQKSAAFARISTPAFCCGASTGCPGAATRLNGSTARTISTRARRYPRSI